ncbi:CAAX protease [Pantanalinema sp. GBBB05]|uniref:Yip1 family protein n=1 Tax=Pantanalinema sp. GBBB05 TaxID=2604139 RepID=UPI001D701000|nr:CAAX protease [Pantanalinema sp. GBBB05]
MTSTALAHFWEILGYVFALNSEAFRVIIREPSGLTLAITVIFLAGLSQAIAQSIILFINRVKPARFVLSVLINALLLAAGFFFLVFSTWLVILFSRTTAAVEISKLFIVLGISYAPLIFSFFGAIPHLGNPMLIALSIWNLLAMVVGLATLTTTGLGRAFTYVILGWIVLQIWQRTIGRPIAKLGHLLLNQVAGVDLATDRQDLMDVYRQHVQDTSAAWQEDLRERIISTRQAELVRAEIGGEVGGAKGAEFLSSSSPSLSSSSVLEPRDYDFSRIVKTTAGLIGIAVVTYVVIVFFRPLRDWWFGWYNNLSGFTRFVFDLAWIGVIAIVVAGLLAPLETLGWWAGWFEDEVDTTEKLGALQTPIADPKTVARYLVYLDGICQSDFKYLPDVEEFLDTLGPTLPTDIALVRGLMVYSVMNHPLNEDRPLAFLWKLADRNRYTNPADLLGYLVNLRNVIMVGVSADKRYGPLYNQGIAQVVYNGLIKNGYQPGSGVPVTLIGYSGGGQMSCASAPYLKQALSAPVDVISLGGVISGNNNILQLEHLYHLVGQKDTVEQVGPIMFPGRWKLLFLSYWNRAKRRGKISLIDMGPVGHQIPGGILDPKLMLSDGRSSLQHTIATINAILQGELLPAEDLTAVKPSNYSLYMQADCNRPTSYPIQQSLPAALYQPIGTWMGRLILPALAERSRVKGALFEVYHADAKHQHLVGKIVNLRWSRDPRIQQLVAAVKQDIHFSAEASYTSKYGGLVHPDRLNHWLQVDPLESLAGAHPEDDIVVMLHEPVEVDEGDRGDMILAASSSSSSLPAPSAISIYITSQPIQITGRFYALVQFIQPIAEGSDEFRVVHFNPISRQFDGAVENVRLPPVVLAAAYGSFPSTTRDLEKSPLNEMGWYIYGTQDAKEQFVVQSLAPRSLLRLQPDEVIFGKRAAYNYIRKRAWADAIAQKGKISSVLCTCRSNGSSAAIQAAIDEWQEGDRALLIHVYGGIGGNKKEPSAATPIFFGHFAYGLATVIREPLSHELRFDIRYHQVYTHNTDGLIAGTLHWSRYLGDRQLGWVGNRPICDIVIKHAAFTGFYEANGVRRSPLELMLLQLQVMTSRYRTGDGTGGTYVGPANNCAQDSNQALFASLQQMEQLIRTHVEGLQQWAAAHPDQAHCFQQLLALSKDLKQELQPFRNSRTDWTRNEFNLGSTLEDQPFQNLIMGLGSWRTMLPRFASDTIVKIFLKHGATAWVLRTNQIGGYDPDIVPIVPMTL